MRKLKFIHFIPDIFPYTQTDGAPNNKTPTPPTINPTRTKQMAESEWTASKSRFHHTIY